MTKDITLHRKGLFLLGAMLVILGSFSPWSCFGDLVWYCSAGVSFYVSPLLGVDLNMVVIIVALYVAGSLIISTIDLIRPWRGEIIIFIISASSFLIGEIFIGGPTLMLCAIALWGVFRPDHSTRQARLVTVVSTSALMLTLIYFFVYVLYYQIAEQGMSGGTVMRFGLPIALAGSVLMFATQRRCRRVRDDQERRQRAIDAVGKFRSGQTDVSTDHDRYLAEQGFEGHSLTDSDK